MTGATMQGKFRTAALVVALTLSGTLAGCGSTQKVTVSGTTTISKGQQLTDLQSALVDGAITQSEYDRLRSKILNWPN
jgi:hypothetical protein